MLALVARLAWAAFMWPHKRLAGLAACDWRPANCELRTANRRLQIAGRHSRSAPSAGRSSYTHIRTRRSPLGSRTAPWHASGTQAAHAAHLLLAGAHRILTQSTLPGWRSPADAEGWSCANVKRRAVSLARMRMLLGTISRMEQAASGRKWPRWVGGDNRTMLVSGWSSLGWRLLLVVGRCCRLLLCGAVGCCCCWWLC